MDFDKKKDDNEEGIGFDSRNPEEHFLVDMFGQITERLKQKYNYSDEQILTLCSNESMLIPITIFAGKLSPAEAITKFLKENQGLSYHEISELIGRDQRGVWASYKRAMKKMPWHFEIKEGINVPVSIFNSGKSILESLVSYLKGAKRMHNNKIAQLLNKNPANVWTIHKRAKKKENYQNKNENNANKNEN